MRYLFLRFMWFLPLVLFALNGCGKKADTQKPIEQIQSEVQNMSVADLQANAQAYAAELSRKKGDMEKIQDKLKQLSPQELFGEKANSIKDELSKLGSEVKALSERYEVYANQFKSAGGDINQIKVS